MTRRLDLGEYGRISTRRLSNGSWRASCYFRDFDGQRLQPQRTADTEDQAVAGLTEDLGYLKRGGFGTRAAATTSVAQLGEMWLEWNARRGLSVGAQRDYRGQVYNHIIPAVGSLKLREVTPGRLDDVLMNRQKAGLSSAHMKTALSQMFALAVRHGAIPANPVREVSRLTHRRPKARPLEGGLSDIEKIRDLMARHYERRGGNPGPRPTGVLLLVFEACMATGCRVNEVLALRWRDLDLDSEVPTARITGTIKTEPGLGTYRKPSPKTESGFRTLPLPRRLVELLREHAQASPPNACEAVFATRNGTWFQDSNLAREWRIVRAGTDYEWVSFTTFRDTLLTAVARQKGSRFAAMQAGHADDTVTKVHYIGRDMSVPPTLDVIEALTEPPAALG